jgi:hypothetical protein
MSGAAIHVHRFFEPLEKRSLLARKAQKNAVRGTQQPSAHDLPCYLPPEPTHGERH